MATHTGNSALDQLIEKYLDRGDYNLYADMGGLGDERAPLDELRTPEGAEGRCMILAEDFAQFLQENGVRHANAEVRERPATWGYQDRTRDPGFDEHWVTTVWDGDANGWHLIDWTAAQFGYTEFPMVQFMTEDRTIIRDRDQHTTAAT